jgi:hypothetical protein
MAARQFQLVYHGGPERPDLWRRRPDTVLSFIVTTASPVIRTWSLVRKNEECPGV